MSGSCGQKSKAKATLMDATQKNEHGLALQQDALRELEETLEDTLVKDIPTLLQQAIQTSLGVLPVKRKLKMSKLQNTNTFILLLNCRGGNVGKWRGR